MQRLKASAPAIEPITIPAVAPAGKFIVVREELELPLVEVVREVVVVVLLILSLGEISPEQVTETQSAGLQPVIEV